MIVIAAFLFWSSVTLQEIFYEAVSSIEGYAAQNQILVAVVFVALAALSAMLSPFSSVPLVPIVIMIWGNLLTASLLLLGWMLGGVFTYAIGYYAGYPLVSQLSSFEKIRYYKEKLSQRREFLLVLLFRFAMPAEVPGYVLGIARYSFGKYLLATFLAELPFAIITSYASQALLADKPLIFISWIIIAFLIIGSMFYIFTKKIKK